jgi:nitroimidazol reductase NimA-like FMN-containing flavoprotein (pyridoxamine 5'-phosphate oxidase superfamily)
MTPTTTLRRLPARALRERAAILAVFDAALVCHLGFVVDGHPVVTPTLYVRVGDSLYVHGSAASRTVRALGDALPACVTASLVDGIVVARAAFHHSVNYRSAMAFGTLEPVEDAAEKLAVLEALTEKVVPGRWPDARPPTRQELKGTSVLRMALDEVSGKARTGPPADDEADLALDAWAGTIPLETRRLAPVPAPGLRPAVALPAYLGAAP